MKIFNKIRQNMSKNIKFMTKFYDKNQKKNWQHLPYGKHFLGRGEQKKVGFWKSWISEKLDFGKVGFWKS